MGAQRCKDCGVELDPPVNTGWLPDDSSEGGSYYHMAGHCITALKSQLIASRAVADGLDVVVAKLLVIRGAVALARCEDADRAAKEALDVLRKMGVAIVPLHLVAGEGGGGKP